jgi:hypothetical protein
MTDFQDDAANSFVESDQRFRNSSCLYPQGEVLYSSKHLWNGSHILWTYTARLESTRPPSLFPAESKMYVSFNLLVLLPRFSQDSKFPRRFQANYNNAVD